MKFKTIAVTGFSGSGKTALTKDLDSHFKENYHRVVTATTREMRVDEVEGIDYFYISEDEFKEKIKNGDLVEYAKFNKNYYGTPFSSFSEDKINLVACEPSGVMSLYNHSRINLLNVVNIDRELSLILNSVKDEKRVGQITARRANREEEKELDKIPVHIRNQIINFENNYGDIRAATLSFNRVFNSNNVANLYDTRIKEFIKENLSVFKRFLSRNPKNETFKFALEALIKDGVALANTYDDELRQKANIEYMSKVNSFMSDLEVFKVYYNSKTKASNLIVRNSLMEIYNRASILSRYEKIAHFYNDNSQKWSEDKKLLYKNLTSDIVNIKNSNGFIDKKIYRTIEATLHNLLDYKKTIEKKLINPIALNSSYIVDYITGQYERYRKHQLRIVIDSKKMDFLHNDAVYKIFFNDGEKQTLSVQINQADCFTIIKDGKSVLSFDLDEDKYKMFSLSESEIISLIEENKNLIKSIPQQKQTLTLYMTLNDKGLIDNNFKPELYIRSQKLRDDYTGLKEVILDSQVLPVAK